MNTITDKNLCSLTIDEMLESYRKIPSATKINPASYTQIQDPDFIDVLNLYEECFPPSNSPIDLKHGVGNPMDIVEIDDLLEQNGIPSDEELDFMGLDPNEIYYPNYNTVERLRAYPYYARAHRLRLTRRR